MAATIDIDGLYKDNFWEDATRPLGEGFDVLVDRLYQGKESWKELAAFMEKRAKIEDDYARQVLNVVKTQVLGKDETGTVKAAFDSLCAELSSVANLRIEHSKWLVEQLAKPVMSLKDKQKAYRKQVTAEIDKIKQSLDILHKKAKHARDRYVRVSKDAEATDKALSTNTTLSPQDLTKMNQKLVKLEADVDASEEEYWKSVVAVRKMQERVEIACDQFQLLDVQRIDYLRDVLLKYEDAERSLPPKMNEALVRFMATVEAVDPSVDTRAFVEAKRLNSVPRPPWPYVEIIQSRMNGPKPRKRPQETTSSKPVECLEVSDTVVADASVAETESNGGDQVRVLYDLPATNPDELTLRQGEIITVLTRTTSDEGWWKGRLPDGQVGIFPGDYTEIVS